MYRFGSYTFFVFSSSIEYLEHVVSPFSDITVMYSDFENFNYSYFREFRVVFLTQVVLFREFNYV